MNNQKKHCESCEKSYSPSYWSNHIKTKTHISNSTPITKTELIITPIIENNFVNIFTEKMNELIEKNNILTEKINEVIEKNNILIEKMNELIIVKEVEVKAEVEVEVINSNNFDEESIKYNNTNEFDNFDDDETVKYNNSNESDEFDDVIESTHLEKNKECNIYYAICKEKKFLYSEKRRRLTAYNEFMENKTEKEITKIMEEKTFFDNFFDKYIENFIENFINLSEEIT